MTVYSPIVEAFGTPAVGKSHLVGLLLRYVERQGIWVQREPYSLARSDRAWRLFRKGWLLATQMPGFFPYLPAMTQLMRQSAWSSRAGALKGLFSWLLIIACLRHLQRAPGPAVLMQGAFQGVWSLAYRAHTDTSFPLEAWVDLTISMLPNCSLVVLLVTASDSVVARRLDGRTEGQSILDREGDARMLDHAQRIIDDLTVIIRAQSAKGRLRLLVYDNSTDGVPEEELARLACDLGLTATDRTIDSGTST